MYDDADRGEFRILTND